MPVIKSLRLREGNPLKNPGWYLLAALLSGVVCLGALRSNNLHMVKLREQVYQADKNNGDVRAALTDLQHYVTSHMNTDLTPGRSSVYPPIQLKYTYERLLAAQAAASSNQQVYSEAQKYCEQQNSSDFSGRNRVPCIADYVSTHGSSLQKPIPDSLYKFDFVSPVWSPDLAGWSLLATISLFLTAVMLWVAKLIGRRRIP